MVFTVEPGLYIDPEREAVTFRLREYSEEEMWERRFRLGVAAAKKLEEEEKAPGPQGDPSGARASSAASACASRTTS